MRSGHTAGPLARATRPTPKPPCCRCARRNCRRAPSQRRVIRAPGLTALFLIGDDEAVACLAAAAAGGRVARAAGAVGLVVNVESMAALTAWRGCAPGAGPLAAPVAGDDLAQRLGLRHYPVLITATGVEQ
ncbi:MAG: integrating conjugative element protein [Pseudoxanthomonas sp.]|nr:integrating conjugative element protein [Pseudoxanthomonas sp.]